MVRWELVNIGGKSIELLQILNLRGLPKAS